MNERRCCGSTKRSEGEVYKSTDSDVPKELPLRELDFLFLFGQCKKKKAINSLYYYFLTYLLINSLTHRLYNRDSQS